MKHSILKKDGSVLLYKSRDVVCGYSEVLKNLFQSLHTVVNRLQITFMLIASVTPAHFAWQSLRDLPLLSSWLFPPRVLMNLIV